MPSLPTITHLQFLILSFLKIRGHKKAKDIRQYLETYNAQYSLPNFVQIMKRMEKAELITGWRTKTGPARNKFYQITNVGEEKLIEAGGFYYELLTNLWRTKQYRKQVSSFLKEKLLLWIQKYGNSCVNEGYYSDESEQQMTAMKERAELFAKIQKLIEML